MNKYEKLFLMGAGILAPALIAIASYKVATKQCTIDKKSLMYGGGAALVGGYIAIKILSKC